MENVSHVGEPPSNSCRILISPKGKSSNDPVTGGNGILLVTHGSYGEALIQNVCCANKRPPLIVQLGVAAQDDPA